MATVTSMVENICYETGLRDGSSSRERQLVLDRLNDAYKQILAFTGGVHYPPVTVPSGGAMIVQVNSDATLSERFLALKHVRVAAVDGTTSEPLTRVQHDRILSYQKAALTGIPTAYSFQYPYVFLDRAPATTDDVILDCAVGPLPLAEDDPGDGSAEASPTSLHPMWHELLLLPLAFCLVLERYEGREADAAYHRAIYRENLAKYQMHLVEQGGFGPASDIAGRDLYNTPNPIFR